MDKKVWSRLLLSTALAGGLVLAMGTTARAGRDYKGDCNRRLEADRAGLTATRAVSASTAAQWIATTTASMWASTSVASQQ